MIVKGIDTAQYIQNLLEMCHLPLLVLNPKNDMLKRAAM